MAEFVKTAGQVQRVLDLLNGMDMSEKESVRRETLQCVSEIQKMLEKWCADPPRDAESISRSREQIADCRASLFACLPKLEEVQTERAERYRSECGGKTEQYEKLSDTLQQQMPEVYHWKRNYDQVTQLLEEMYQLNGQLMDLGSQLEQEHLDTLPAAQIGGTERFDRDPAPSANP